MSEAVESPAAVAPVVNGVKGMKKNGMTIIIVESEFWLIDCRQAMAL